MNREQLIMNIKYYLCVGLAKTAACCATIITWISNRCTDAEIYLTAQSTKYRFK
jgi:hypothetical protein